MTRTEALEGCSKEWHWLAEHPDKNKDDYFRENNIPEVILQCYCCEFVSQGRPHFNHHCSTACPLIELWPGVYCPCETEGSPYLKWLETTTSEKKSKYALIIAEAADKELACE